MRRILPLLATALLLGSLPADALALFPSRLPGHAAVSVERSSARVVRQEVETRLQQLLSAREARRLRRLGQAPATTPPLCGNGVLDRGEECDDGNTADGDGCSSLCIVVPEPVRRGFLRIEEVGLPDDGIIAGQRDKPVLRFRATTGRQDVRLHGLTLIADVGDAQAGWNYRLYRIADDGTAAAVSPVGTTNGAFVVLDHIDALLPVLQEQTFEVRADIRHNPSSSSLSLGFDAALPAAIQAVGAVDGRELTGINYDGAECGGAICWVEVWTQ